MNNPGFKVIGSITSKCTRCGNVCDQQCSLITVTSFYVEKNTQPPTLASRVTDVKITLCHGCYLQVNNFACAYELRDSELRDK